LTDLRASGSCTCPFCPTGKYQAHKEQTQCDKCEPGRHAPLRTLPAATGHTSCPHCAKGRYAPAHGRDSECSACAPGQFAPKVGHTTCPFCDAGQFQPQQGQPACQRCPMGRHAPSMGHTKCPACGPGHYSSDMGAIACSACEPGRASFEWETDACEDCKRGRYAANYATFECEECPRHQVQVEEGQTRCETCDYSCAPGWRHTTCGPAHKGECIACRPGHHRNSGSTRAECTKFCDNRCEGGTCGVASYAENMCICIDGKSYGAHVCSRCEPGTVAPSEGMESCVACGPEQWQDAHGAIQCKGATRCDTAQWQTVPLTASSDRHCENHRNCTATEWESRAAGTHHNRECTAHTTCRSSQFQSREAGTHHDRVCQWHYTCHDIEWEVEAPTRTSDRKCDAQQQCQTMRCEMHAIRVDGIYHQQVRVHHHHMERRRGFLHHKCAYDKKQDYCFCLCNRGPVDWNKWLQGSMRRMPSKSQVPSALGPPQNFPTEQLPPELPRSSVTNVDQCKKWTRLTEVRRTAIPGGRGARAHGYDLAKANLTVAGRLVIQNNVTVLLRVTPSKQLISPLANDTYVPQDKSAALYILDSRTPFAGRAEFGCLSNQCYMGGGSMMCATSADHKLRMASKAEGVERWYDNGNAEQGPCSFGQSSYGNLAVWDVCSAFAGDAIDQTFRTQPVAVHGHAQATRGWH